MKLSISLPDDDLDFLDRYADEQGLASRSAAVQRAIRMLRASSLGSAYEDAWTDWEGSDDATAWSTTLSDGLA